MDNKLREIEEATEQTEEGVWIAQEDCPNCKGNGFTLFNTEAGYERGECYCLIPENRMFNARAPEWLRYTLDTIKRLTEENETLRKRYLEEFEKKHD